jgi:hypothetical protein
MDKIFTQEELFWLDDILPGTKIGRIRRLSAGRTVHIPKSIDENPNQPKTVNRFCFSGTKKKPNHFQPPMDRLDNNSYRDRAGNNLLSITEVGLYNKLHKMSSNV